jgi:hypothetical protein
VVLKIRPRVATRTRAYFDELEGIPHRSNPHAYLERLLAEAWEDRMRAYLMKPVRRIRESTAAAWVSCSTCRLPRR